MNTYRIPDRAAVILTIADRLDQVGLQDCARTFRRALFATTHTNLRLLVLGRFSVGKSTLINAFLGYPVLPGGFAPTTSALCQVRYGPPGAIVRFNDGRVERLPGPETINPYLSTIQMPADSSPDPNTVIRVEVDLPLPLLKGGVEIVDSPGLDENSNDGSQILDSLLFADAILLVTAADQSMSRSEQDVLINQVLPLRPGALAIALNFWDRVAAPDRDSVMNRVRTLIDEITGSNSSLPIFPVSALATLKARWKFIGETSTEIADLENWIENLSSKRSMIREAADRGRIAFAAQAAMPEVERQILQTQNQINALQNDLNQTQQAIKSLEETVLAASDGISTSYTAAMDGMAAKIGAGRSSTRENIRRRLQADPFDPLTSVSVEIAYWWNECVETMKHQSIEITVQTATRLSETLFVPQDSFPAFDPQIHPPTLDRNVRLDASAPIKDTITGLIGGVSGPVADSAARLMKKATSAAVRLHPQGREAANSAERSVEESIAIAAFKLRSEFDEWTKRMTTIIDRLGNGAIQKERAKTTALGGKISQSRSRIENLNTIRAEISECYTFWSGI